MVDTGMGFGFQQEIGKPDARTDEDDSCSGSHRIIIVEPGAIVMRARE